MARGNLLYQTVRGACSPSIESLAMLLAHKEEVKIGMAARQTAGETVIQLGMQPHFLDKQIVQELYLRANA